MKSALEGLLLRVNVPGAFQMEGDALRNVVAQLPSAKQYIRIRTLQ